MRNVCKQDTDKVLLVEGDSDCHVVMALCQAHAIPESFGIYQCGSDVEVLKRLNALIPRPDPPQVIGIMLDADNSVEGRWTGIQKKLSHYDYHFPTVPNADGTIVESSTYASKLGFWLMPNNQVAGMLEDFCAELADPGALAFAQRCVEQAQENHWSTFKASHSSKAIIYTYLAWQDEPGSPLGRAITKQSLRPHSAIAITFTNWLRCLFT